MRRISPERGPGRSPIGIAGLAALLTACGAEMRSPPVVDAALYDLKKPGITCMHGLRFDERRGCTLDVAPGEAELRVKQRVEMSPAFLKIGALYVLDGHVAYVWNADKEAMPSPGKAKAETNDGSEAAGRPASLQVAGDSSDRPAGPGAAAAPVKTTEVARAEPAPGEPILDIAVPPGEHVLQVLLRLQGNGYGVFAYLRGYKFEVRSTHRFTTPPGVLTEVTMNGQEKGGVTTPLEERPAVAWGARVVSR